jgi:hypothetical protein
MNLWQESTQMLILHGFNAGGKMSRTNPFVFCLESLEPRYFATPTVTFDPLPDYGFGYSIDLAGANSSWLVYWGDGSSCTYLDAPDGTLTHDYASNWDSVTIYAVPDDLDWSNGNTAMIYIAGADSIYPYYLVNAHAVLPEGGQHPLDVYTLSLNTNAQLDLNDNSLHVWDTSLDQLTDWLITGYDGGNWDGSGIVSTWAPNNGGTLGLFFNSVNGATIRPVNIGDVNGNGWADQADLAILTANNDNGATSGHYFFQGDLNYDGKIDNSDHDLLVSNMCGSAISSWAGDTLNNVGNYNFYGTVQFGDNGALGTHGGELMGTSTEQLSEGLVQWDNDLSDGVDSGWRNVTFGLGVGETGHLSMNVDGGSALGAEGGSSSTISQVTITADARDADMGFAWRNVSILFYHNGDLVETNHIFGGPKVSTYGAPAATQADAGLTIVPSHTDCDYVIVSGNVRLTATVKPDYDGIFGKIYIG